MANDHPRDGCHPWDRLEDYHHFGEGDHPKKGDHHRDGDHPRVLEIFTIVRDGYLILGPERFPQRFRLSKV